MDKLGYSRETQKLIYAIMNDISNSFTGQDAGKKAYSLDLEETKKQLKQRFLEVYDMQPLKSPITFFSKYLEKNKDKTIGEIEKELKETFKKWSKWGEMKIKEYATERIKDIQEFLKGDGIEESIRKNNYSVIEILEYIEDMCMAEVKETLERFEKKFEIYYERNGFDEISDEYMQQIAILKSVINTCQE